MGAKMCTNPAKDMQAEEPVAALVPPRGIIFDCDGVVIDSRRASRYVYNFLRDAVGLPPLTPEDEEYVFSQTTEKSLARVIPPQHRAWAAQTKEGLGPDEYLPRTDLQPGIARLLDLLKEMKIPTALNSNGGMRIGIILKFFRLHNYFSRIVTAQDVERPKPDPQGILSILQAWNLDPDQAVYIGDSSLDMQAAQAAGVPFWSYANRDLNAQVHIDDFNQLSGYLITAYSPTLTGLRNVE
jgi:HAD superfamily hydrolase (TIGR01509 family)